MPSPALALVVLPASWPLRVLYRSTDSRPEPVRPRTPPALSQLPRLEASAAGGIWEQAAPVPSRIHREFIATLYATVGHTVGDGTLEGIPSEDWRGGDRALEIGRLDVRDRCQRGFRAFGSALSTPGEHAAPVVRVTALTR